MKKSCLQLNHCCYLTLIFHFKTLEKIQRKWTLRLSNSSQFLIHPILHLPKCMELQYLSLPQRVELENNTSRAEATLCITCRIPTNIVSVLASPSHSPSLPTGSWHSWLGHKLQYPILIPNSFPRWQKTSLEQGRKDIQDTFDLLHFQMWTSTNF
jgi:hypothetical protein